MSLHRVRGIFVVPEKSIETSIALHSECDVVSYSEFRSGMSALPSSASVVCWLFCPTYDAFDIASVLQAHGFQGALICIYHVAADPKMIAAELAMVAPKLDIKLVQTDHFDKTVLTYAMSIMRS